MGEYRQEYSDPRNATQKFGFARGPGSFTPAGVLNIKRIFQARPDYESLVSHVLHD